MTDLYDIWPDTDELVPTKDLVTKLIAHNPEHWGENSNYGKALTDTRFGRMVTQASKVTSQRPGGRGPRGYLKAQFIQVWHRLGIGRSEPGAPGEPGEPGAAQARESHQVHRDNHVHRVQAGQPLAGDGPGAESPGPTPLTARKQGLQHRRTIRFKGQEVPRCYICSKAVTAGQGDAHLACLSKQQTEAS